jgi:hypothetical protein
MQQSSVEMKKVRIIKAAIPKDQPRLAAKPIRG